MNVNFSDYSSELGRCIYSQDNEKLRIHVEGTVRQGKDVKGREKNSLSSGSLRESKMFKGI